MFVRHFNVEQNNNLAPSAYENDQVEFSILLCAKQKVILTSNLRLSTSLVNGLLGSKIVVLFNIEMSDKHFSICLLRIVASLLVANKCIEPWKVRISS